MDWLGLLFDNQIDSMIFAGIAVISFICLLVAMIADGVFDFLDFDFDTGLGSLFSAQGILAFATGFGASGWILTGYFDIPALYSSGVAIGGGAAVMIPVSLMHRVLIRQVGDTSFEPSRTIGTTAMVTLPIPGDASGLGQISISWGGGSRTVPARTESNEAIAEGRLVRIVTIAGGVYYVDPTQQPG